MNPTLPQGPARRGFGFLSPPAPRACLGRTRVVSAPSLLSLPGEWGGGLRLSPDGARFPTGRGTILARRTLPEVMPPVSDMTQEGFSVSGARWARYANGARPARGDRANLA
jgi:hypothetical protein